ncbi:hypothetical protein NDU88_000724 [Pleurodeles waltl]|uniref:Uncharacterized protein n=1 Tax=Pleurodeles waltl TaxID=8319 RepID=A0AAV7P244_PLEWA|nr:hypothetical protein NDU88_000724 [Pleurodeles waltl]
MPAADSTSYKTGRIGSGVQISLHAARWQRPRESYWADSRATPQLPRQRGRPHGEPGYPGSRTSKNGRRIQKERAPFMEDAGGVREEDESGTEEKNDVLTPTASPKTCGTHATPTKEEETDGRESRHVPGGTWLYQSSENLKPPHLPYFPFLLVSGLILGDPRGISSPVKRKSGKEENNLGLED